MMGPGGDPDFFSDLGVTTMRRAVRRWAILGLGGLLVGVPAGFGQKVITPPRSAPAGLDQLAGRMAAEVRHLGEAIATRGGETPSQRFLIQDAAELAQAVTEFQETVRGSPDRFRVRQAYAGIDATWHHLQRRLDRLRSEAPEVAHAVGRVAQFDDQLHRALNVGGYPAIYTGNAPAPAGGSDQVRRLSRALADRAEALAAALQADRAQAGVAADRLVPGAVELALAADAFGTTWTLHPRLDAARLGFARVNDLARKLQPDLDARAPTARVRAAWQAFKATVILLRESLQLPNPPVDLIASAIPVGGSSPVIGLAAQLVEQVDGFLSAFTPAAKDVPEGGYVIADARRLRAAAADFRQEILEVINVGQLADAFLEVDAHWQRLARRVNRLEDSPIAPFLAQLGTIGRTCGAIHQLLGIPGYPPELAPIANPG
jgi:hypothetical protein